MVLIIKNALIYVILLLIQVTHLYSNFEDNIKNLKNNEDLRAARYNFYYCLDMINSEKIDIDDLKNTMEIFIKNIKSIYDKFGYDKNTLKFINAYHLEIADLLNMLELEDGLLFLLTFDSKNKNTYESYIK